MSVSRHQIAAMINESFAHSQDSGLMLPKIMISDEPAPKEPEPLPVIDQTRISNKFRTFLEHNGVQQECAGCHKVISRNKTRCAACQAESESLKGRAEAAGLVLP